MSRQTTCRVWQDVQKQCRALVAEQFQRPGGRRNESGTNKENHTVMGGGNIMVRDGLVNSPLQR
jgi:hypothetical protein